MLTPADDRAAHIAVCRQQSHALQAEHQPLAALASLRECAARYPDAGDLHFDLAMMLTHVGRLEEGEALLRALLAQNSGAADVRYALALTLLAEGKYAEAWPLHAARETVFAAQDFGLRTDFPFSRCISGELAGRRVLVFPEQGLGDQIQLVRFLPWLRDRCAAIELLALPPLARLFSHSFPDIRVTLAAGEVQFQDPDCWLTPFDLPALAGATLETLPQPPYLRTSIGWGDAPPGFKVGIMLQGNRAHMLDGMRSLPPAVAAALRERLQGTVIDLDPARTGALDLAATAAIIDGLDLVVSVDTAVGHLAGALGKPCLLLVPGYATDWRWLRDRRDSPWYPHHRLYRSTVEGDWSAAIECLTGDARAFARGEMPT